MRTLLLLITGLGIFYSCKDNAPEKITEAEDYIFAVEIGNSEIPYVVIDTRTNEIQNEPKIAADMTIYVNKLPVQKQSIGIEYRGSTSFRLSDKKSYGIETWDAAGNDVNVSFFGFPEEGDWILNGHVVNLENKYIFDRTLMYHYFGYEVSRSMGKYASRCKYVELEINGEYMGVYVFMEKLKRDKNRIDISSLNATSTDNSGGYIIKIDKSAGGNENIGKPLSYFLSNWDDDARYTAQNSFRSAYDIYGGLLTFDPYGPPYHSNMWLETYFMYEYPKADVITTDQKTYISSYINQFENALLADDFSSSTRTYTDYIDLNSFVEFFILNELVRNIDGYRLSTFLQKDRGGKLAMGPIWDLNIGYDTGDRVPWDGWVIHYNQYVSQDAWMMPFWWPRLLEDPIFRAAVKVKWQQVRSGALSNSNLIGLVDQTAQYLKVNGAIRRNYQKWDQGIGVDYDGSIESLKNYLRFRTEWMDAEIGTFE